MLSIVFCRSGLIALICAFVVGSCAAMTAEAEAADAPQVATQLPDTTHTAHVYLFQFKKNDVMVKGAPEDFCPKMDYGMYVAGHQSQTIDDDGSIVKVVDWVICKFPTK